jgi:hypothetical protein
MDSTLDVARLLQHGVITALVHVASARAPGASALAIEFDAAQRVVAQKAGSTRGVFKVVFSRGLPLHMLKKVARDHVAGDRRLLALRHRELIQSMNAREREDYITLVLAAAEAALRAEVEERSFLRRRISSWERMALEEIQQVFKSDGWNGGPSERSARWRTGRR